MWKWRKREETAARLKELHQSVLQSERSLSDHMKAQTQAIEEQAQAFNEQIGKLTRLQYKSAQDIQSRLERLNERADAAAARQETLEALQARLDKRERATAAMAESMMAWLDDLDSVCAGLRGEEQQAWQTLLRGWTARLIASLAAAGIRELPVLGAAFDPGLCEAVATRPRRESEVPYQIVEVVRRGFVDANGALLRKARVITVEEEKRNGEQS